MADDDLQRRGALTSTRYAPGPLCRLPSGRVIGCEYLNGDPGTSIPHRDGCHCARCEPEMATAHERVRDAAPDLLAALRLLMDEVARGAFDVIGVDLSEGYQAARAAVAKAEGRV